MRLLHAGVDTSVIAMWLGHESVETTQIYLHADLTIKERALARTAPTTITPGRHKPQTRSWRCSKRSDYPKSRASGVQENPKVDPAPPDNPEVQIMDRRGKAPGAAHRPAGSRAPRRLRSADQGQQQRPQTIPARGGEHLGRCDRATTNARRPLVTGNSRAVRR